MKHMLPRGDTSLFLMSHPQSCADSHLPQRLLLPLFLQLSVCLSSPKSVSLACHQTALIDATLFLCLDNLLSCGPGWHPGELSCTLGRGGSCCSVQTPSQPDPTQRPGSRNPSPRGPSSLHSLECETGTFRPIIQDVPSQLER